MEFNLEDFCDETFKAFRIYMMKKTLEPTIIAAQLVGYDQYVATTTEIKLMNDKKHIDIKYEKDLDQYRMIIGFNNRRRVKNGRDGMLYFTTVDELNKKLIDLL